MPSLLQNVTFDCAVPVKLARFWSEVTGQPVDDYDSFYATVTLPNDTVLYFARVPESKTVKNRVHVCLRPDVPRDTEVARLIGIGARLVTDHRRSNGHGWAVLADPEGNEFCVLRNAAGR